VTSRVVVLDLSPSVAVHVAHAIAMHRADFDRRGLAVPPDLLAVQAMCASRAMPGQDGPPVEIVPARHHRQDVTTRLLTKAGAAQALGVSESTAKRLIRIGQLASVHVGGLTRVRCEDLDAYLQTLTPEGT
jgi:excisionase family DNA binding protein